MNLQWLDDNHMVKHLCLATCGVRSVGNFTFSNPLSLDPSGNPLKEVRGFHVAHMLHLLFRVRINARVYPRILPKDRMRQANYHYHDLIYSFH